MKIPGAPHLGSESVTPLPAGSGRSAPMPPTPSRSSSWRQTAVDRLVTMNSLQAGCVAGYIALHPGPLTFIVFGPLLALLLAIAYGMRKLTPWGRDLQIVCTAILLLGIPLGMVFGVFLLVYPFKPGVKLAFSGRPPSSLSPSSTEWLLTLRSYGNP